MSAIRHVFFDIGGVLGTNGWDREQREHAVSEFQLDAEDFQYRHEQIVGEWEEGRLTLDEYLDIAVFNVPRKFSREEFVRFMQAQSVPDDGAIAVARAVNVSGRYSVMTLNNESDELNRYRIDRFALAGIFDAFLSSCWLGVRKPTRRFFTRALSIAHAEPATTLFIDDRQQNITPARTLGMNVILFESAPQLRSSLERALDLQLPGA